MVIQQSIVHKSPQRRVCDSWEWISAPFSVRGAYKRLCKGQFEENNSISSSCRFLWRQKVPLKVQLFGCLLLWKRLMTQVFDKRLCLESSAECGLHSGAEEDCAHLFFECPFTRSVWDQQTSSRIDTTSKSSFWESFYKSGCRREDGVCIHMVLWATWLHRNDKVFIGRDASIDGAACAVEGFVATWSSRPRDQGA